MISIFASVGITPAYAGNTKLSTFSYPYSRDHPRLRGEHGFTAFTVKISLGSPPHTRGTRYLVIQLWSPAGITPAYAGNTASVQLSLSNTQDHPRLRGEHKGLPQTLHRHPGSPPLTRGTPVPLFRTILLSGITPAYAGNTEVKQGDIFSDKDHPRIRGEHQSLNTIKEPGPGSPPHTRGTPHPPKKTVALFRITPAYAGNTFWHSLKRIFVGDHPRIRGEHIFIV